jgi:coenzyme F420-reducing hydrogenase beta subunit
MVFEDHKKMLEGKYRSEIIKIDFRYKPWEWKSQSLMVQFANNKKYINTKEYDSYYKLFLPNIILRPSCYSCPFTNLQRNSDLTIADFWGIEKSMPEFEDTKGVSLLLVNTEKGEKLFSSMKDRIIYKEICLDDCMQTNLMHPSVPSPKRDAFWRDYHKFGYEYVVKQYAKTNIIKHTAKKALKKIGLFDFAKSILKK